MVKSLGSHFSHSVPLLALGHLEAPKSSSQSREVQVALRQAVASTEASAAELKRVPKPVVHIKRLRDMPGSIRKNARNTQVIAFLKATGLDKQLEHLGVGFAYRGHDLLVLVNGKWLNGQDALKAVYRGEKIPDKFSKRILKAWQVTGRIIGSDKRPLTLGLTQIGEVATPVRSVKAPGYPVVELVVVATTHTLMRLITPDGNVYPVGLAAPGGGSPLFAPRNSGTIRMADPLDQKNTGVAGLQFKVSDEVFDNLLGKAQEESKTSFANKRRYTIINENCCQFVSDFLEKNTGIGFHVKEYVHNILGRMLLNAVQITTPSPTTRRIADLASLVFVVAISPLILIVTALMGQFNGGHGLTVRSRVREFFSPISSSFKLKGQFGTIYEYRRQILETLIERKSRGSITTVRFVELAKYVSTMLPESLQRKTGVEVPAEIQDIESRMKYTDSPYVPFFSAEARTNTLFGRTVASHEKLVDQRNRFLSTSSRVGLIDPRQFGL